MINFFTNKTRSAMDKLAISFNSLTKSQITPNFITLLSFAGHFGVLIAIINDQLSLAAILVAIFGLMDAFDGALARVQKKASPAGMMLDATSDRAKEFLIYFGLIFLFADAENVAGVLASALALGGSFMVSYVKAKGETAIASSRKDHHKTNRLFASGLMQYQTRMVVLIAGLALDELMIAVTVIAVLSWLTALIRLIDIVEAIQPKSKK